MKGADHFTSCEFTALLENNSYNYPQNKTAVVHLLQKKKISASIRTAFLLEFITSNQSTLA